MLARWLPWRSSSPLPQGGESSMPDEDQTTHRWWAAMCSVICDSFQLCNCLTPSSLPSEPQASTCLQTPDWHLELGLLASDGDPNARVVCCDRLLPAPGCRAPATGAREWSLLWACMPSPQCRADVCAVQSNPIQSNVKHRTRKPWEDVCDEGEEDR